MCIVSAATLMLVCSFSMAFAVTDSPTHGIEPPTKVTTIKGKANGVYDAYSNGAASLVKIYNKSIKTKTVPNTVSKKGKTYKVTTISKYAFKGCKKLKTIKVKSKYLRTVQKGAFKGLKTKKMTVKVTKKMSKANFKHLKSKLRKAGFKGKIKRVSM